MPLAQTGAAGASAEAAGGEISQQVESTSAVAAEAPATPETDSRDELESTLDAMMRDGETAEADAGDDEPSGSTETDQTAATQDAPAGEAGQGEQPRIELPQVSDDLLSRIEQRLAALSTPTAPEAAAAPASPVAAGATPSTPAAPATDGAAAGSLTIPEPALTPELIDKVRRGEIDLEDAIEAAAKESQALRGVIANMAESFQRWQQAEQGQGKADQGRRTFEAVHSWYDQVAAQEGLADVIGSKVGQLTTAQVEARQTIYRRAAALQRAFGGHTQMDGAEALGLALQMYRAAQDRQPQSPGTAVRQVQNQIQRRDRMRSPTPSAPGAAAVSSQKPPETREELEATLARMMRR